MTIIETTRPYETLIRHNADGSIGAHHVRIAEIVRDGSVISATTLPPVALDVAAQGDDSLVALIGTATLAAISDATSARAALATCSADLAAARKALTDLQAKADQGAVDLSIAQQTIDALRAQAEASHA